MPFKSLRHPDNPFVWCGTSPVACEDCRNKCALPEELRIVWKHGVTDPDHYHADPKVISVTETLNCPLKAVLERTVDYTETPKALMARAMGSLIHAELEAISSDGCSEVTLSLDLGDGYTLRGTADRLTSEYVKDYKTMDAFRKTVDQQHKNQLSIYNDMAGGAVRDLSIVQVTRKGMNEMPVEYNPEAFESCVHTAKQMVAMLKGNSEGPLPPAGRYISHNRAKHCDYCPFEIRQRCEEIHPLS